VSTLYKINISGKIHDKFVFYSLELIKKLDISIKEVKEQELKNSYNQEILLKSNILYVEEMNVFII